MARYKISLLVAVILFTAIPQGCIIVPFPRKSKVVEGELITRKQAKELNLPSLTREQVLQEVGNPTLDLFDSRVLVYHGRIDHGAMLIAYGAGYYGGGGLADWGEESALFLAFDEDGRYLSELFESGMNSLPEVYLRAMDFAKSVNVPYDADGSNLMTSGIFRREFGEPTWDFFESRILVYRAKLKSGLKSDGSDTKADFYMIFDEEGRLVDREKRSLLQFVDGRIASFETSLRLAEKREIPYSKNHPKAFTKEMVLANFGEPDWIFANSRILAYEDTSLQRALFFVFDEKGAGIPDLLASGVFGDSLMSSKARKVAEKHGIPLQSSLTNPDEGVMLYVERSRQMNFWAGFRGNVSGNLILVNGYRIIDDPRPGRIYSVELPSGEHEVSFGAEYNGQIETLARQQIDAGPRQAVYLFLKKDEKVKEQPRTYSFERFTGKDFDRKMEALEQMYVERVWANIELK